MSDIIISSEIDDSSTIISNEINDDCTIISNDLIASTGGGVSKHSELILNDGTNPHGTTLEDVDPNASNIAYKDEVNTFTEKQIIDSNKPWVFGGTETGSRTEISGTGSDFFMLIKDGLNATLGTLWFSGVGKFFATSTTSTWDLGTSSRKWKELFLSSYANVLGVKSATNDPNKVFATDGSEVDAGEENTIDSITSGEPTGSDQVINVVSLTQAEYDAGTPIATTFYIITD